MHRVVPPIERVRMTVWTVPIVFPDSPIRHTFCYVIRGDDGQVVLIDPGFDSEEGWQQLERSLATAGASVRDVVGIVATHMHSDHLGMARRVVDETGAWVGMHPTEDAALAQWQNSDRVFAEDRQWLDQLGVPAEVIEQLATDHEVVDYAQSLARMTLPLTDGTCLPLPGRQLVVVAAPGHTPGHICIVDHDERVLFSGDHILPRITPNVGLTSTGRNGHALTRYYESLERMKAWPDYEVLAAHEYRFVGLAERAEALIQHQHERSAEILGNLRESPGLTGWQLAARLTWARPWSQLEGINMRAALGEVDAHLDHLHRSLMLHGVAVDDHGGQAWSSALP